MRSLELFAKGLLEDLEDFTVLENFSRADPFLDTLDDGPLVGAIMEISP